MDASGEAAAQLEKMRHLTINFFDRYVIFSEVTHFLRSSSDGALSEGSCLQHHPLTEHLDLICELRQNSPQLEYFDEPNFLVNSCFTVLGCL